MANNNIKEFTIKINGLEQSLKSTKSLGDAFLTVDKNILKVNTSIETLKKSLADIDKNVKIDVSALIDMKKMEGDMQKAVVIMGKRVVEYIPKQVLDKVNAEIKSKLENTIKDIPNITKTLPNPFEKEPTWLKKRWDKLKEYISTLPDIGKDLKQNADRISQSLTEAGTGIGNGFKNPKTGKDSLDSTIIKNSVSAAASIAKGTGLSKGPEKEKEEDPQANAKKQEDAAKTIVQAQSQIANAATNAQAKVAEATKGQEKTTTEAAEAQKKAAAKAAEEQKKEEEKPRNAWEAKHKAMVETTKKYSEMIKEISTAMFNVLSFDITSNKEKAEAELKETTAALAKVAEEKKKSTEKINDLENKAKDARGGRAIAIQEQITSEMANNEKLATQETQLAKKKEKAEKDKAKAESREKRLAAQKSIIEATMNIAQGVTKAWSLGPVIGPILAAVVAAAGAVQITTMTKKMSKLADGGILKGKRHSQGGMRVEGTNIEVEGGEYVINRQSTDQNLGLVRYINSQRRELSQKDINSFFARTARGYEPPFRQAFAEGGQFPVMTDTASADNEQLIEAIRNIKLEPRVAVTDIIRAQESMTNVDNWVGI